MISVEQAHVIINKTEYSDVEAIEVVQLYIFLKKGVNIPMNRPTSVAAISVLDHMYKQACNYFISV